MWTNALLVLNSGVNSIVYFFRGRCKKWKSIRKERMAQKKHYPKDKFSSNNRSPATSASYISDATPVPTPVTERHTSLNAPDLNKSNCIYSERKINFNDRVILPSIIIKQNVQSD